MNKEIIDKNIQIIEEKVLEIIKDKNIAKLQHPNLFVLFNDLFNSINVIKKELVDKEKTPTIKEVCKALSEYYQVIVEYNSILNSFVLHNYYGEQRKFVVRMYEGKLLFNEDINYPICLITMISRFYEGVLENE